MIKNHNFSFVESGADGVLKYENAITLEKYIELTNKKYNIRASDYKCFWAFSKEQVKEECKKLDIPDGTQLHTFGGTGIISSSVQNILDFLHAADTFNEQIKEQCDPQEVYVYEYNNHECMYDCWEGDQPAYEIICDIFGVEEANKIRRINAWHTRTA